MSYVGCLPAVIDAVLMVNESILINEPVLGSSNLCCNFTDSRSGKGFASHRGLATCLVAQEFCSLLCHLPRSFMSCCRRRMVLGGPGSSGSDDGEASVSSIGFDSKWKDVDPSSFLVQLMNDCGVRGLSSRWQPLELQHRDKP